MRIQYSPFSIPTALVERMKNILARHPDWAYTSTTAAIIDILRRWCEENEAKDAMAGLTKKGGRS